MIYLDNNATTPVAHEVASAMDKCLRENFGNPSSSHSFGIKAKKVVDKARNHVAELIGAKAEEIIFTSGGTEANNMALIGTAMKYKSGHIIASCIEHPSVASPLKHLESLGFKITYLPVSRHGRVTASDVLRCINKHTILITVMHSNNETGSIQPISAIGKIAKNIGIPFHCDAAQSVGKVPVSVNNLNVNFLTIVSHKFYGPKGVGALFIKNGTTLKPLMFGASHERGLRPGTENVASIVGLGKASSLAKRELPYRVEEMKHLSQYLYHELRKKIQGVKLNGHSTRRLPNTLNLSFPNISGAALLSRMKNEIAASTGSACHAGRQTPSGVLSAMGLSDNDALSSLRISLGRTNTQSQVRKAAKVIARAYRSF